MHTHPKVILKSIIVWFLFIADLFLRVLHQFQRLLEEGLKLVGLEGLLQLLCRVGPRLVLDVRVLRVRQMRLPGKEKVNFSILFYVYLYRNTHIYEINTLNDLVPK